MPLSAAVNGQWFFLLLLIVNVVEEKNYFHFNFVMIYLFKVVLREEKKLCHCGAC